MRKASLALGVLVAVTLALAWGLGGFDALVRHAQEAQRLLHDHLAGAIRQVKAGAPSAVLLLIGLCFGYGVVHAVGPGHGKMLIGAYALANRVSFGRLALVSLVASLAQAGVAVILVYAGVLVLDWTRAQMTDMADGSLVVAGNLVIGAIGAYLALRGWRLVTASRQPAPRHHDHHHVHDHGHDHDHGPHCGHAHGVTPAQVAALGGWRDGAMLVAGIAIRPCSGAILVLLLCWRIGNDAAGIAGAFAMGLGTAAVTVLAAGLGATLREGTWATGLDSRRMGLVMGALGLLVGLVLVVTSGLLLRAQL